MPSRRSLGPSTKAIHGQPKPQAAGSPIASPIFQSSTFTNPIGTSSELLYTRYGNNPNQLSLGERLSELEQTEAAIFLASGMGATALAHLAVLRSGDHLISSRWIYGGTYRLFVEEFKDFGIDVTFVDPSDKRSWKKQLRKNTRAIFVETPTNPLNRVLDLRRVAAVASANDLVLLVDSTFATPINYRPVEHGADVVIHSATKYLNGHSDVIAGAVAASASIVETVRQKMLMWGQAIDPVAAWLVERGLKTLAVRIAQQNQSALDLARWLERQERVKRVHYPGLRSHPDYRIARRVLDGCGGIIGIELTGGARAAERMLKRLRIAAHAPSLGGVETLVSEPRFTSHESMTPAARAKAGIPDGFVRISVGLEDVDDLIEDFANALTSR